MRPCLVKLQSSLLREFQFAPICSIFMKFPSILYGTILGFVKSHGVTSIQLSSSLRFTFVKNTDCLPRLRILSSHNQSTSDYGMDFTHIPDVVDALGKSFLERVHCLATQDQ